MIKLVITFIISSKDKQTSDIIYVVFKEFLNIYVIIFPLKIQINKYFRKFKFHTGDIAMHWWIRIKSWREKLLRYKNTKHTEI